MSMRKAAPLAALAATALTLSACAQRDRDESGDGGGGGSTDGTFTFGAAGAPEVFDPFYASDGETFRVTRQIFEGLVEVKEGGSEIGPGLATEWEPSADGTTWTFTLRDGVKFTDGETFDAEAVCANFERMADQNDVDLDSIIDRLLEVRGSRPGKQVQLLETEIRYLCTKSREIFISQPILLELEAPIKVSTKKVHENCTAH